MTTKRHYRYLIYHRETGEYIGCYWMRRSEIGWNANLLYIEY